MLVSIRPEIDVVTAAVAATAGRTNLLQRDRRRKTYTHTAPVRTTGYWTNTNRSNTVSDTIDAAQPDGGPVSSDPGYVAWLGHTPEGPSRYAPPPVNNDTQPLGFSAPPSPPPAPPSPEQPQSKPKRRWPIALLAFVLGAAIAGGSVGATVTGKTKQVAGPTVHVTKQVPGPTVTETVPPSTPAPPSIPAIPPNPAPPDSTAHLKVGTDTLSNTFSGTQDNDNGQTLFSIDVTKVATTSNPPDEYSDPPQHGYFATFTVHAVNAHASAQGIDISPSDFYVLIKDQHYTSDSGHAYEITSTLDYVTLAPTESTKGTVAFDIPARHGQLVYAPNYDGLPLAYWSF